MKKWSLLFELIIRSILPPFYSFSYIESICKDKLNKRPNDTDVMWFLGNVYVWYGKYAEARTQLEKLYNIGVNSKSVKLLLSNAYFNLEDYEKVVHVLSAPNVLSETDIENYYLGDSLIEIGRFKDSIEYLRNYVRHHPKDFEVFERLGYAYYMVKMYDLAMEAYMEAKKLNPMSSEIIENIKLCLEKKAEGDSPLK